MQSIDRVESLNRDSGDYLRPGIELVQSISCCPRDRGSLEQGVNPYLYCPTCGSVYPIVDGVYVIFARSSVDELYPQEVMFFRRWCTSDSRVAQYWESLQRPASHSNHDLEWVHSERLFWEREYVASREKYTNESRTKGNRLPEREKYLFRRLREGAKRLAGGEHILVEIGSGLSETLDILFRPAVSNFTYVLTDVSLQALMYSVDKPNTICIACTAGQLPIRAATADILLFLGILHHIPQWHSTFERLCEVLKPAGMIGVHEVVEKQSFLQRRQIYKEQGVWSPHEDAIEERALLASVNQRFISLAIVRNYSSARSALAELLIGAMRRSRLVTDAVLFLDRLFIACFAWLGPRLRNGAIILTAVKGQAF